MQAKPMAQQEVELSPRDRQSSVVMHTLHRSTLNKFLSGDGLTVDTVDGVMNTVALVNALVLTIPYSIAGTINNQYWDWLLATFELPACAEFVKTCGGAQACWNLDYNFMLNTLYATVYSSITVLCIVAVYYIQRPPAEGKDDGPAIVIVDIENRSFELKKEPEKSNYFIESWWPTARFVIIFVVCATFVAVVSVLTLFGGYSNIFINGTANICDMNAKAPNMGVGTDVGVFLFVSVLILSIILMFGFKPKATSTTNVLSSHPAL